MLENAGGHGTHEDNEVHDKRTALYSHTLTNSLQPHTIVCEFFQNLNPSPATGSIRACDSPYHYLPRKPSGTLTYTHSPSHSTHLSTTCGSHLKIRNKAKAKGLLEVTALVSGDTTRRNIPGNSFRRAKARLLQKDREAGLDSRGAGGTKDTGDGRSRTRDQTSQRAISSGSEGCGVLKEEDESKLNDDDDEVIRGVEMRRLKFGRSLSRVTEEDCMGRESSFVSSNIGIGGRNVETSSGGDVYSEALRKGMEETKPAAEVSGSGRSNDVPLVPIREDKAEDSAEDSGRRLEIWNGGKDDHGGSCCGEEAARITGRVGSAREPGVSALREYWSTGMVAKGEARGESGGGDDCAFRGHDKEPEALAGSPLDNVRTIYYSACYNRPLITGCECEGAACPVRAKRQDYYCLDCDVSMVVWSALRAPNVMRCSGCFHVWMWRAVLM